MAKGRNKKRPRVAEVPAQYPGPRAAVSPEGGKSPRFGGDPNRFGWQKISWHLGAIDYGGPYCPSIIGHAGMTGVLKKLKGLESMTWNEILQNGDSHPIEVSKLEKDARDRLKDMERDDVTEVVSLRITGKKRLFGVRYDAVLQILWWDSDHAICKSSLKHT